MASEINETRLAEPPSSTSEPERDEPLTHAVEDDKPAADYDRMDTAEEQEDAIEPGTAGASARGQRRQRAKPIQPCLSYLSMDEKVGPKLQQHMAKKVLVKEKMAQIKFAEFRNDPRLPIGLNYVLPTSSQEADGSRHRQKLVTTELNSDTPLTALARPHDDHILSDQIHVLGTDLVGRYLANAIAACSTLPPVCYLIHSNNLWRNWVEEGRILTLHRGREQIATQRVIGEFVSRDEARPLTAGPPNTDMIRNLIITAPAGMVVSAFQSICHRVDYRTTICLVQDGLGLVEEIIDIFFPDPHKPRPNFVLGHLSTTLGYTGRRFSVAEIEQKRLNLVIYDSRSWARPRVTRHPPVERLPYATHFVRLMLALPDIHASGHRIEDFLRHKLPRVTFRAVADSLATMLDCTYDKLLSTQYARQLLDELMGEACQVVSRLPELRLVRTSNFWLYGGFRKQVHHELVRKGVADSYMRALTYKGFCIDVDFLCGWFVRRGREVGVAVKALETTMFVVKAKRQIYMEERREEIPLLGMQGWRRLPDMTLGESVQLATTETHAEDSQGQPMWAVPREHRLVHEDGTVP